MIGSAKHGACNDNTAGYRLKGASGWRAGLWIGISLIVFGCGGRSRDNERRDDGGYSTHGVTDASVDGGSKNDDAGLEDSESTTLTPARSDAGSGASDGSEVAATSQPGSLATTDGQFSGSDQLSGSGGRPESGEVSDGSNTNSADRGASGDSSTATNEPAPIVLPDGCEAQTHSEGDDACFLNTRCTGGSDLTMCSRLGSGRWQCGCEFNHTDRTYEVDDVQGVNPCAAVSWFCTQDTLLLGDEACEPVGDSDEDACNLTLSCGRPIEAEVETGAVVRLMDIATSQCVKLTDGSFDCDCAHWDAEGRHGVATDTAADACATVAEFCRGTPSTPVEGPESCVTASASSTTDGCELIETCTKPLAVVAEVAISEIEPRGSYCSPSGPTTSRCYCSDQYSSFSYQVETADSSCETTSSSCRPDVDIQPSDDPTCVQTSEYSSAGDCHADLDCSQPATVDGREVMADGRLLVWCRQAAIGEPWWCSCASDQVSATFEYGTSDGEPRDVCVAAPAGCMQHMQVHLGAYGEFKPAVDPLSAATAE